MGHTYINALRHLLEAASDIEITDIDADYWSKPPCETCKISHAPQQISRRPMITVSELFERVHFDLIDMQYEYNKSKWIIYFYDKATRNHFTYSYMVKSNCVNGVKWFVNMVKNQYGRTVKILKSNQESTLGRMIMDLRTMEGIAH